MSLTAAEQLLIEMINRSRLDPEGEAALYGIALNEDLASGTLNGDARQALSPNELLHNSSDAHGAWLLETDTFSHTGENGSSPGDRMAIAGYEFTGTYANGENITYRGSTGSINLDTLMENNHHKDLFLSAGHRVNMLHDFYREIGVSQLQGLFTTDTTQFNASMVVENFALSGNSVFLTGVSYTDSDDDGFYSIGEGRANVGVTANGSNTQTAAAGGYAIELAASADVHVALAGIPLSVDLSAGNGKLDLVGTNNVLTSVDTTLTGAAGSLTALGVGNINLTGHSGADVLVGNKGDNILAGGDGTDTVRYDLTRAQASFAQLDSGAIQVVSTMGTDTLSGIETIVFSDETVATNTLFAGEQPEDDTAYFGDRLVGDAGDNILCAGGFSAGLAEEVSAQVYRLYSAALDRVPDSGGHANWAQALFAQTQSLSEVSAGFVKSVEFQNTYGELDTSSFVELLYQNVLNRASDPAGRSDWIARIDNDGLSRADAVLGFSESPEFVAATKGAAALFAQERTASEWSDDLFRLYSATLDRDPDLGGFSNWAEELAGGLDFLAAVTGFVESAEFRATYGDLDDADFVELLYNNVLDREPDVAGRQGWLDALAGGQSREEIVRAFVQSPEFRAATAEPLHEWIIAQGVQDVIKGGVGDDVLAGGLMSDMFVFDAASDGDNTVLDLEAWDVLRFDGFGYGATADALARFNQNNGDLIFSDQGVTVMFTDTALSLITDDMIHI